jgi:hypothetical protein
MTAHRITITRDGQTEDEIWADTQRCQASITDLLGPAAEGVSVDAGPIPGGAETSADTWCGSCGEFMWHGADCECADKADPRPPLLAPPYAAACPECFQTAIREEPADQIPWQEFGVEQPQWTHANRSYLCPRQGPDGPHPGKPELITRITARQARNRVPDPRPGPQAAQPEPEPEAG